MSDSSVTSLSNAASSQAAGDDKSDGGAFRSHFKIDKTVKDAYVSCSIDPINDVQCAPNKSSSGGGDSVSHASVGSTNNPSFKSGGVMEADGESGAINSGGWALARSESCPSNDESVAKHRSSEQAYEEMEHYLQKAQDEINATFGEDFALGPQFSLKSTLKSLPSPPRVRKIFQQLQQKSPPALRKSRHQSPKRLCTNLPSPPKLPGSPNLRKKFTALKSFPVRRVSSPALRTASQRTPWRDHHLQTWSQSLLKDFDTIVQEEICKLNSDETTSSITSDSNSDKHIERFDENPSTLKRKLSEHSLSFPVFGGQNSLPPKPPLRISQCKPVNQQKSIEKEKPLRNYELRKSLSNSEDFRKHKSNFNSLDTPLPVTPTERQKFTSYTSMGASSSNLGPGDGPGLYGTLPRNRRRVSLGVNSLFNVYSPEHPDAPASPCQLVRVGPRLSRSHSLDEAFVPLSQKTYFVPTPSTPAPTPQLKKDKFPDKNRRKGVCDAPKIPISLFDLRRASTSTQGNSISSNNSSMSRNYHNGRHSIPGYGKNTISSYPNENELISDNLSAVGRYSKSSRTDDKRLHGQGSCNNSFGSKMLTLPDPSRVGRKSEPYLPAYCVLPVQYLDGRRHTLPVRPTLQTLNIPPAFNTTSWDALPPAEEVEVMEDKPLQLTGVKYLSYPASAPAMSGAMRRDDRKYTSVPPALDISMTSSYSVNSSLSSLSAVSCHDAVSETDPTVMVTPASQSQPSVSCSIVHSTAPLTLADQSDNETHYENTLEQEPSEKFTEPRLRILGDANSTDGPSPVSSPEPAKLKLRPLKEEPTDKDVQFSVATSENHKRKKRKVKPKRYSDTCLLVRKAHRSKRVTRNRSAACNFAKPSRDYTFSDDSGPEMEDNSEFLRYCFDHLNIDRRSRGKLLLKAEDRQNLRNASDTNILRNNSEVSSKNKMVRRSWSMDVVKKAPTLRSSRSAKDVSYRKAVVGEEASREFLKQVVTRIPKSRVTDGDEKGIDHQKAENSGNKSCSVSTQTHVPSISPAASTCWTSDVVSLDPYASSIGFSATEDDMDADGGDEQEDDSDTDEEGDGWWAKSFSSSSPRTPPTPTSLARRNSSPSLSESLDTLDDLNEESGLGTTSTRPSVSPPPQAPFLSSSPPQPTVNLPSSIHRNMERSTSNLSSEDTGVDVSINRKVRRTLSSRRAREALLTSNITNTRAADSRTIRVVATCDRETQTEELGLCLNNQGTNRIKSSGRVPVGTPIVLTSNGSADDKVENNRSQCRSSSELESNPLIISSVTNMEDFNRRTSSEPRLASIQCKTSPCTTPKLALKVCHSDASLSVKNRLGNTLPVLKENFISAVAHDQSPSSSCPPPIPLKQKHLNKSGESRSLSKENSTARPTQLTLSPCYDPQSDSLLEILKLEPDSFIFGHTGHLTTMNKSPNALNSPSYSLHSPSPIATCTLPFPQNTCFGSGYFFDAQRQILVPFSASISSTSVGESSSVPSPSYIRAPGQPAQHLALSSGPPTKATSTPSLASHGHIDLPSTVTSATSNSDVGLINKSLSQRATSNKELAEIEASESCKWLRAAGFPQYAQMYEELRFPLDLTIAERDHTFLEPESMNALFRRLKILNRCARIRLDHQAPNKAEESEDEEQQCALSSNWLFERHSGRWSRVGTELEVGKMLDVEPPPFKRSGSERIKDSAKALLRRMESMKAKKKRKPHREGGSLQISRPILSSAAAIENRVAELGCIDLQQGGGSDSPSRGVSAPRHRSLSRHTHSQGEDSSSLTSDQSQNSTPLFRSRRRKRFLPSKDDACVRGSDLRSDMSGGKSVHSGKSGGGSSSRSGESGKSCDSRGSDAGAAFSDSECSLPTYRSRITPCDDDKVLLRGKLSSGGSEDSYCRHTPLQHSSSVNIPHGLSSTPPTKEQILINNRNKLDRRASPPPSPDDERHSIYDNVPIIICNRTYQDYRPDVTMDSASSAREGSGSSECCTADSRGSPCPSNAEQDVAALITPSSSQHLEVHRSKRKNTVERWHSFNDGNKRSSGSDAGMHISHFSAGQMLILRKRALLRLTALMEHHCPSRPTWNWELPKFMTKRFRPSENKTNINSSNQVFGVALHVTQRKTGYPLPPVIIDALRYLDQSCSDQVGLFRKPGVRSRIQKLRELIDQGETVDFATYGAYDVADMVKTYFRELPEVLLTNKLSEVFLAIFHYLPESDRMEAMQCALLMLPDENREALMTLLTFLDKMASKSHLNQMTASNLAVCLAPSLFHLCVGGPLRRKNVSGSPEQKDLNDNKAAHVCLQIMIQKIHLIDFISAEMLSQISFTYLETSQPVHVEDLGLSSSFCSSNSPTLAEAVDGTPSPQHSSDWAAYMDSCIAALIKEVKEKNRAYVSLSSPDPDVEVIYRKVGDGHPLRLWRVTTEVEAPPAELLNRVLQERHLWDDTLAKWRTIARLDRQSDVWQYLTKSMLPKPSNDFCVLRCWRSDMGRVGGSCALVETSVEHPDAKLVEGCTRGIVLVSRYFIQPCGSGKSRVTHISRVDLRGRSPEWYNKNYGALAARKLARLRDSFKHFAEGPESKV